MNTENKIKTISSKKNNHFETRKEHVETWDGNTFDRVVCYTLDGKFLGGIREANLYVLELEAFKEHLKQVKVEKKVINTPNNSDEPVQESLDSEKSSEPIFPEIQRSSVTEEVTSKETKDYQKKNKRSIDELGY